MRNKIFIVSFVLLYAFFLFSFLSKEEESISKEERRNLTTLEDVQKYSVLDSYFSGEFEKYLLDQVPCRKEWKMAKARMVYDVFLQQDNHGLYYQQEHWFKRGKPYNAKKVEEWVNTVDKIQKEYENANAQVLLVPDKENYVKEISSYAKMQELLNNKTIATIDVKDMLRLQDYYRGDPHLKQEGFLRLLPLLEERFQLSANQSVLHKQTYLNFYGAYSGQGLSPLIKEELSYYTNEVLSNAKVTYLENEKEHRLYVEENLEDMDSYNVFLDGASSFIHIENTKSTTDKSIIVFRDSYGSSLSCLLPLYYENVYVVDLRYISYTQAKEMLPRDVEDLLFVYGEMSISQIQNKW